MSTADDLAPAVQLTLATGADETEQPPAKAGRPRTTGAGIRSYPSRGKNYKFGSRWAQPALRARRLELGLSQVELAERVDGNGSGRITKSKIWAVEKRKMRAPIALQAALADALDEDVDVLFEADPREQRPDEAERLYVELKSYPKVADRLGVAPDTARAALIRAGVKRLPPGIATLYPEERAALADSAAELRRKGWSVPAICRELETNPTLTFTLLEERDLPRVSPAERAHRWLWEAGKVSKKMIRSTWSGKARRAWKLRIAPKPGRPRNDQRPDYEQVLQQIRDLYDETHATERDLMERTGESKRMVRIALGRPV